MVTRRTDARRRRVLSEEFVPTDQSAVAGNKKPMQAYSYGANRRNQPKTTDLIPKRSLALSFFFVLIIGVVATINALAWYAVPLTEIVGEAGSRSLAIYGPGTLANWFCSVCLLLCAGVCLQLFLMRKHKRDDYGGMYRVWILMAAMFVLASIDCAIDLRTISAKLFEMATHRSLIQSPWLMMTIELIILGLVVIRMLFEVRTSTFSLATVLLVWVGFVGCIVLRNVPVPARFDWIEPHTAYGNCILLGCVGSLVALTIYSRYVFLHAHGLIREKTKAEPAATETEQPKTKAKKRTRASKKAAAESAESTTPTRISTAPEPATAPLAQNQRQATAAKPTRKEIAAQKKAAIAAEKKAAAEQKAAQRAAADQDAVDRKAAQRTAAAEQKAAKKRAAEEKVAARKAAAEQKAAQKKALAEQKAADKLRAAEQKKAAAEAARAQAATTTPAPTSAPISDPAQISIPSPKLATTHDDNDEDVESVSMSKSERRRQRKLAKRAARAKKAA